MTTIDAFVWVFLANGAQHPGAVFSEIERAEEWILRHRLSGVLTKYPLDIGAWEWAVAKGYFKPKHPQHSEGEFVARFTSASMEHYHFEGGIR